MKQRAILIAIATLLVLPSIGLAQIPSFSGVVSVDTVVASPGSHFGVPIRLSGNNIDIAGMQLPLQFDSDYLTIDSISFVGSLIPDEMETTTHIDNGTDIASIVFFPSISSYPNPPIISSSDGILATLFCTLDQSAPAGMISIDTLYDTTSVVKTMINFSDDQGIMFMPSDVVPGAIEVTLPTALEDREAGGLPMGFALAQNYPNPFNPVTTIEYALPRSSHVRVEVFNILGQQTAVLVDKIMAAGYHQVTFDGAQQPSGIFFYRISHSEGTETKKMVLLK